MLPYTKLYIDTLYINYENTNNSIELHAQNTETIPACESYILATSKLSSTL